MLKRVVCEFVAMMICNSFAMADEIIVFHGSFQLVVAPTSTYYICSNVSLFIVLPVNVIQWICCNPAIVAL